MAQIMKWFGIASYARKSDTWKNCRHPLRRSDCLETHCLGVHIAPFWHSASCPRTLPVPFPVAGCIQNNVSQLVFSPTYLWGHPWNWVPLKPRKIPCRKMKNRAIEHVLMIQIPILYSSHNMLNPTVNLTLWKKICVVPTFGNSAHNLQFQLEVEKNNHSGGPSSATMA